MATARLLAKSLSTSEKRAKLHEVAGDLAEFCQSMYPLFVAHSDDYGRLEGSVFHVKHAIEPTSPRTVTEFEAALYALAQVGLVDWYYDSNNRPVLQVIDFKPHQPGLKQRPSKLEAPTETARRVMPCDAVDRREKPRDSNLLDSKRNETNKSSGDNAPRIPAENVKVIGKLVHEAMDTIGVDSSELTETVKGLCAIHGIVYDSETVGKAIDSARVQRRKKKSA